MSESSHTSELPYDIADEYRLELDSEPQPPAWQDGSVRVGIHASIAGDLINALESTRKLGCNALQIFSASPRMWPRPGTRIAEADAARFRARREALGLGPLVIHANYLINLATPDAVMRTRTIQAFHDEIVRALALGADFLVVHPGSSRGTTLAEGIARIGQGLRLAMRGVRPGNLRILIENTSGMGAAIGARFAELRGILDTAPELPLGICLDTAHTLHAGYEIRTAEGLDRTLDEIEQTVGLDRVFVVHVNDSKTPLGSRVDRHQHIGRGTIGRVAFGRILLHPRIARTGPQGLPSRALILETPIDKPGDDRRNVQALWEVVGFDAEHAPKAEAGFSMLRSAGTARRKSAKVAAKVAAKTRAKSAAKRRRPAARRARKLKRKRSQR
ncbi:MAG: deoxyribonuclease IV [Candidatus Acidiferrales bacterium]